MTIQHLAGLTVCVDYAMYLESSIARWAEGLDKLVIVTTPRDTQTRDLCAKWGITPHLTEIFYANGAHFNKGAAMAEAFEACGDKPDWFLFFDADVVPPASWREDLNARTLRPTALHGCTRVEVDGRPIPDAEIAGFFHLAHVSDPKMQIKPVVDTHFIHAGNYDTTFMERWPRADRIRLPLCVTHVGEPHANWCGIGNEGKLQEIIQKRRQGKNWRNETITPAQPADN